MKSPRALRRRYGRSALGETISRDISYVEEYVHDHAEIAGAALGAIAGAALGDGFGGAVGTALGGLAGAGVGLALRRAHRVKKEHGRP